MLNSTTPYGNSLINDLVKTATFLIIAHILLKIQTGKQLFDQDSVYSIIYVLLGLIFYWILIAKFIPPL